MNKKQKLEQSIKSYEAMNEAKTKLLAIIMNNHDNKVTYDKKFIDEIKNIVNVVTTANPNKFIIYPKGFDSIIDAKIRITIPFDNRIIWKEIYNQIKLRDFIGCIEDYKRKLDSFDDEIQIFKNIVRCLDETVFRNHWNINPIVELIEELIEEATSEKNK